MSSTNCTKKEDKIQRAIKDLFKKYPIIKSIVEKIYEHQARALLVGGAVRDSLLGLPIKDVDIEVHGLTMEQLESLLKQYGVVSTVGKSFGVLKIHGLDVDWSLPRADTAGRKPQVVIDPNLSVRQAFARRDLTMNAMGIDLITGELIDPFNGQQDIQHKILRTPDPNFFVQDPLRFYRVMQFIARFEMYPDEQLNQLCKTMDVSAVSRERIEEEFKKMFLKSHRPSLGFRWLHEIRRISLFPELAALVGIPQDPYWHPEGDVFEHTMQSIDAINLSQIPHLRFGFGSPYKDFQKSDLKEPNAEHIAHAAGMNEQQKLILMYAALCHDLGKVSTTEEIDGKLRSRGHDVAGVPLSQKLLKRIMNNQIIIATVKKLVKYHMAPGQFVALHATLSAYKRLARKLAPETNLQMLGYLAYADRRGRNGKDHKPLTARMPIIDAFFKKAAHAEVLTKPEEPVLKGADLMGYVSPGPKMGELLRKAYRLQLQKGIKDKEQLKKLVLAMINN